MKDPNASLLPKLMILLKVYKIDFRKIEKYQSQVRNIG